jgi:hypothetical protein
MVGCAVLIIENMSGGVPYQPFLPPVPIYFWNIPNKFTQIFLTAMIFNWLKVVGEIV